VSFQGIVKDDKIWDGCPAELGTLFVRGAWRAVDTDSLVILNFRLADIPQGGDPAFMVYHHLHAYFPANRDQILEYIEVTFSFDPTSSISIATQKRKLAKAFLNLIK
jgi:hypothetical protein